MQPRWDDLQDFLAIARAGQIARAATVAGIDPTTLARHLRRLETTLGQTLFEQTREGQMLTAAGESLLVTVEAMQQAAARIAAPDDDPDHLTGVLRVSVSEGFGTWFVAHHLRDFTAAHPDLTIDLVASSGFLSPSRREADIAVLLARPQTGPLVSSKLTDYALGLYAAELYAARHPLPVEPAAVRDHPLIGYVPDLLYAPELRYLAEIHDGLEPRIRSSSINAQYRLVAAGAGLGVLPRFIGDADRSLRRVLPERTIRRSFWLVTHQDTRGAKKVRAFREWLTALVAAQRGRFGD
ncbi:DNA-binding transcriptional LysR family regulator [Sphingomonas insulae]|uniref:LysR family transcriptional regulator n=1 Tax=Sphingomonas insulae TaxID=424800 RepID=A0ABP3T5J2_9SPHN|nr:LysR family transcriptional regulator [Sphingomonas insulae]NIJ28583.1 DNA-binding transcriptional LysR family regulator [Sphingomonas insulae]